MSAETDHILDVFQQMLAGPTGDGKNKRDAGLKEHWTTDPTHLRKGIGHLNKYLNGEDIDADSNGSPLINAAWRFLAVAYQDAARRGEAPAPPHPLAEVVGQREFWRDVQDVGGSRPHKVGRHPADARTLSPRHPDFAFGSCAFDVVG